MGQTQNKWKCGVIFALTAIVCRTVLFFLESSTTSLFVPIILLFQKSNMIAMLMTLVFYFIYGVQWWYTASYKKRLGSYMMTSIASGLFYCLPYLTIILAVTIPSFHINYRGDSFPEFYKLFITGLMIGFISTALCYKRVINREMASILKG